MPTADASTIQVGDKVVLTDPIPLHVLREHGNVQVLQGERREIMQLLLHGTDAVWRVKDVRIGHVHLAVELENVRVTSFKEHVFEEYFAVRV